ncbi:MAG: tRNA (cytidine(56)-2'-O)-methyltransferase [Candidatus Bathyarchaeota archaeon]
MEVVVLRLGHRYVRDDRVTTHVFLTARAFGAIRAFYSGQRDEKLEERVKEVVKMWGGPFEIIYVPDWKQIIQQWKDANGELVHLTIYGLPIQNIIHELRESTRNKMVIVGGAKVPGIVYTLADWNISITSQPHSEISALSIFLHELFDGNELSKTFMDTKLKVIPEAKGKKVLKF